MSIDYNYISTIKNLSYVLFIIKNLLTSYSDKFILIKKKNKIIKTLVEFTQAMRKSIFNVF